MSLLLEHLALLHIYLHINTAPPELPPPGIHSDVNMHALNKKRNMSHNFTFNTNNENVSFMISKAKFARVCSENTPPV